MCVINKSLFQDRLSCVCFSRKRESRDVQLGMFFNNLQEFCTVLRCHSLSFLVRSCVPGMVKVAHDTDLFRFTDTAVLYIWGFGNLQLANLHSLEWGCNIQLIAICLLESKRLFSRGPSYLARTNFQFNLFDDDDGCNNPADHHR
jgi:hypothetical protein